MNRFGFHALLWLGWLGFAAVAGAQSAQPTAAELTAKADQLGQQTFKRKTGEVLTFQQIYALPSHQRDDVIDEMTEQEAEVMYQWKKQARAATRAETNEMLAKAEAESKAEIAKVEAESKAEIAKVEAESKALIAKVEADGHAQIVKVAEQIADRMRQLVAIGKKFPPEVKASIERDLKTQYIIDGLKPETLSFLKSVLARPELFRDK